MMRSKKLQLIKEIITQNFVFWIVYFKNYYEAIAIDISKQQALYADLKAIQEINFTRNLTHGEQYFLLLKKQEELFRIFHKEP